MIEFLLGVICSGVFLTFIAWVDTKYLSNVRKVNMKLNPKRSLWFNYLIGSAYEIIFFAIGLIMGVGIK